jgi:hypothetical protein
MEKTEKIISLTRKIAAERPNFFDKKGPGLGDKDTSSFMAELHKQAEKHFGQEFVDRYAEQRICGTNGFKVDFYFPEDETIVEVALSLGNAIREFEKDVIKTILAQRSGNKVKNLIFISKPGAAKRNSEPGPKAIASWLFDEYGITIDTKELK